MKKNYIFQEAGDSSFNYNKEKLDNEMNGIISNIKFRKKGTYIVHSKDKSCRKSMPKNNKGEEWICKITYNENPNIDDDLGKVIEYQMPLRVQGEKEYNSGIRAVDLVSVNEHEKKVFLIEFKVPSSGENPWKAFLEIYTYYNMLGGKEKTIEFLSRLDDKYNGYILIPVVLFGRNDTNSAYTNMMNNKEKFMEFAKDYSIKCYSCDVNDYIIKNVKEEF